jgi:hypothetical protein
LRKIKGLIICAQKSQHQWIGTEPLWLSSVSLHVHPHPGKQKPK